LDWIGWTAEVVIHTRDDFGPLSD